MFISIEGLDGAGKSASVKAIFERLTKLGHKVVHSRQPGGCYVGEQLREVLLQSTTLNPVSQLMLMVTCRRETLDVVILPALEAGHIVLTERFTDSSFAYQVYGGDLPEETFTAIVNASQTTIQPDLTLFFDIGVEEACRRVDFRCKTEGVEKDAFEIKKVDFFEKVAEGYRELMRRYPQRIRRLDSTRTPAEVVEQALRILDEFIQARNLEKESSCSQSTTQASPNGIDQPR